MEFTIQNIEQLKADYEQRKQEVQEKGAAAAEQVDSLSKRRKKINERLQNMIDHTS